MSVKQHHACFPRKNTATSPIKRVQVYCFKPAVNLEPAIEKFLMKNPIPTITNDLNRKTHILFTPVAMPSSCRYVSTIFLPQSHKTTCVGDPWDEYKSYFAFRMEFASSIKLWLQIFVSEYRVRRHVDVFLLALTILIIL